MIRRPPRSTLFPTRRSSDLAAPKEATVHQHPGGFAVRHRDFFTSFGDGVDLATVATAAGGYGERVLSADRSEEHTSELQSPCNLVCRLLLEKKKKDNKQSQR